MPGFLHFIPGQASKPSRALLERHNIGHAVEGERWSWSVCRVGPGGVAGLVLADAQGVPTERVRYSDAAQHWRRIPGSEAWVGFFRGELPGPDDLRRAEQLDGWLVTLGDGRQWAVPRAYEAADGDTRPESTAPRRMQLRDDGVWAPGDVLPEYTGLMDLAGAFFDAAGGYEGMLAIDFHDYAAATKVLAHNYRIADAEADLLGLYIAGRGHAGNVLRACCDWVGYWQKKTDEESNTSASTDGPEA